MKQSKRLSHYEQPTSKSTSKINRSIKRYTEMVELLDKVGLTPVDVINIIHTLPVSWEQYYQSFPQETEQYMMDKLGDPNLFNKYRGMKNKKKTKRKSKGRGRR